MKKILLVDDDEDLLDLAEYVFGPLENISYDSCSSGEAALQKLSDNDYDVLISDFHMPGINGEELIERVKESGSYAHPILYSTDDQVAENAELLGVPFKQKRGGLDTYRELVETLEEKTDMNVEEQPALSYL